MIHQREEHSGLDEGSRSRQDTRVMSPLIFKGDLFSAVLYRFLGLKMGRYWLKCSPNQHWRSGTDPCQNTARSIRLSDRDHRVFRSDSTLELSDRSGVISKRHYVHFLEA